MGSGPLWRGHFQLQNNSKQLSVCAKVSSSVSILFFFFWRGEGGGYIFAGLHCTSTPDSLVPLLFEFNLAIFCSCRVITSRHVTDTTFLLVIGFFYQRHAANLLDKVIFFDETLVRLHCFQDCDTFAKSFFPLWVCRTTWVAHS